MAGKEKNVSGERNIAPTKLELLITVVEARRASYYISLIHGFGANLQISTQAKGTAGAEILRYLGLTASPKTVIFSVVQEDKLPELMETLSEKFRTVRDGKGIAMTVPFTSVIGTVTYGFLAGDRRTVKQEDT